MIKNVLVFSGETG